jgi:hypothetical protein
MIKGINVEVYVQDSTQAHHSAGIYSVLDDRWLSEPKAERVSIRDSDVEDKVNNYTGKIKLALKSNNVELVKAVSQEISNIRKAGLEKAGEFSVENVAFKVLRNQGYIGKLRQHIDNLETQALSLHSA